MKKLLSIILTILITICSIILLPAENSIKAASIDTLMENSIYFSGEYSGKNRFSDENASEAVLTMSQYSSFDSGKEVGSFSIISYGGKVSPSGTLTRIGKNKYKCKKSEIGALLIFKVKKTKVIIKQKGKIKTSRGNLSYAGTYKLKKHFYS